MKRVDQYIIPFKGLKDGEHVFDFRIDQKFFDAHEVLEAERGEVEARILLRKTPSVLSLTTSVKGCLHVSCDRCLDYFDHPVRFQGELLIKFGENTGDSTDEIWILSPSENELDMEQYLFECISLSLPIQRFHAEDENGVSACDPEMLEKLDDLSSAVKSHGDPDPRWNRLKHLLNDTNKN